MFSDDVAELYGFVPIGAQVAIVNGQFGPFGRGFDEIIAGDRGADVLAITVQAQAAGLLRRRTGRHIRGRYEKGAVFLPARQRTGGAEHHHPGDLAEDGLQGV